MPDSMPTFVKIRVDGPWSIRGNLCFISHFQLLLFQEGQYFLVSKIDIALQTTHLAVAHTLGNTTLVHYFITGKYSSEKAF